MLNNSPGCWGVLIIPKPQIRRFITYFLNLKLDVELNVEDSQFGPWWTRSVVHVHFRSSQGFEMSQAPFEHSLSPALVIYDVQTIDPKQTRIAICYFSFLGYLSFW